MFVTPIGTVLHGPTEIGDFYNSFLPKIKPRNVPISFIADGDECVMELVTATNLDNYAKYRLAAIDHFTVNKQGKIRHMVVYLRPQSLQAQQKSNVGEAYRSSGLRLNSRRGEEIHHHPARELFCKTVKRVIGFESLCNALGPAMSNFVFSMDSHVVEPKTLWQDNLPSRFKDRALRTERQDKYIVMIADNKPLHRMQVGDGNSDNPRIGGTDPELRVKDMAKDGIDAELMFPNLGTMIYAIEDGELALACCQVYNDWAIKQFGAYRDTFVPAATLPMRDVAETLDEFRRVVELGYRSVMLPTVPPGGLRYNDPSLDPLWALAEERRIPLAFHIATGHSPVFDRGPGAAVINYTKLSFLTQELVCVFCLRRRARSSSGHEDQRDRGGRIMDRSPRRTHGRVL